MNKSYLEEMRLSHATYCYADVDDTMVTTA
jgi:hypothetical protein